MADKRATRMWCGVVLAAVVVGVCACTPQGQTTPTTTSAPSLTAPVTSPSRGFDAGAPSRSTTTPPASSGTPIALVDEARENIEAAFFDGTIALTDDGCLTFVGEGGPPGPSVVVMAQWIATPSHVRDAAARRLRDGDVQGRLDGSYMNADTFDGDQVAGLDDCLASVGTSWTYLTSTDSLLAALT